MKKMFGGLLVAATILTPLGPAFARPDSPTHSAQRGDRGDRSHRGSGASHPQRQRSPDRSEARSRPASRPNYQQRRVERPQVQRNVERRAVSRPQSTSAHRGRGERAGNDGRHGGYDRDRSPREQWNRNDRGRGDGRDWNRNDRGHNDRGRNDSRNWNRNDRNHNDSRNWNRNDHRWDGNRNDNRYRGDRSRNWNRDWRHDRRYDWRSYRNVHRSYYRLPRYYSPYPHYGYRRFSIGFTLGSLFYGQRYWIDDPWYYRLPPAYGNYRWIRYYDDALLVDIYSGRVVDVIYDFFW